MPGCSPGRQRDPGEGGGSSGDTSQQAGTAAGGSWDRTEATLASLLCPAVTFPDFLKPNYKYSVDNTQREERGGK